MVFEADQGRGDPGDSRRDVVGRALVAAEEQLHIALGAPVEIRRRGKGGVVTIAFANENELQRIYEYLTEQ